MRRSDRGAAAAEFAMIAGLLVFLFLGVLQVAVYFYARNVVAASVADAARFAAADGVPLEAGAARAKLLIGQGLDDADAAAMRCTSGAGSDAVSGLPTVTVHCQGRIALLFLPIAAPLVVDARASSVREGAP